MKNETVNAFLRLISIMDDLREKCPWDRKQTIQSLRQLTIEETYELADAITEEDWQGIKEELGDLLLHIVFYAKIGNERNEFTLSEVITGISDKLVARHPHIYAGVTVKNEEDVKKNWEKLKLKEGNTSILSGVPVSLPAMVKAMRLQEKAKQVGFEWENKDQVWEKVEEEIAELLFSLVNYARFLQIDAENALERTNKKFIRRFTRMEEEAMKNGLDLYAMTLEELDSLWNAIKHKQE